jgi:hypothetical protein
LRTGALQKAFFGELVFSFDAFLFAAFRSGKTASLEIGKTFLAVRLIHESADIRLGPGRRALGSETDRTAATAWATWGTAAAKLCSYGRR